MHNCRDLFAIQALNFYDLIIVLGIRKCSSELGTTELTFSSLWSLFINALMCLEI